MTLNLHTLTFYFENRVTVNHVKISEPNLVGLQGKFKTKRKEEKLIYTSVDFYRTLQYCHVLASHLLISVANLGLSISKVLHVISACAFYLKKISLRDRGGGLQAVRPPPPSGAAM
jgi:hypothetical protein